jgi:hypothetical protein
MKSWTKDQCRDRYCRGQISLSQLAYDSGVPRQTLAGWSASDGWVAHRKRIQTELRTKSDENFIEQASEHLSSLAMAHFKSFSTSRNVIDTYFNWQSDRLKEVANIPERLEAEIKSINPAAVNHWCTALERAVNGERTATGMDWESVPKAIAYLTRLGYDITDPSLPSIADTETEKQAETEGLTEDAANTIRAQILGIPQDAAAVDAVSSEVATSSD